MERDHRLPRRSFLVLVVILIGMATAAPSWAQPVAGAQSLYIDPSVRASGMGGASGAVFWGNDLNAWSNPPVLPYMHGLRYERARTRLVPDLAPDVHFTTKQITLGYAGIGLLVAGRPFDDLGSQRLDYGTSVATDEDGNPVGEFSSHEDIAAFGAAVNILEFVERAAGALGRDGVPALSRYGDVSLGWTEKKTDVFLAPANVVLGFGGNGSVKTHDSGVLFRLTPYNSIDNRGTLPGFDRIASLKLEVAHGRSTLNYDDETISYPSSGDSDPILRTHRTGWAVHAAADLPGATRRRIDERKGGWLLGFITPLIQWGKAWDRQVPMILDPATEFHVRGNTVRRSGWEVTVANIYTIRKGWVEDPDGTVIGPTKGWGVGLRLKDVAGISYDEATVPQSVYLEKDVHRKAFSVFVNPFRLWRTIKR